MKRKIAIILAAAILLCLSGCGRTVEFGIKTVIVPSETVTMAFKDKANKVTNEDCTIILTNDTEYIFCYEAKYWVEGKKDEEWYEFKTKNDAAWTANLFELRAGESKETQINWESIYGRLPKGEYRIVRPGYLATENPTGLPTRVSDEYAVAEFEITK